MMDALPPPSCVQRGDLRDLCWGDQLEPHGHSQVRILTLVLSHRIRGKTLLNDSWDHRFRDPVRSNIDNNNIPVMCTRLPPIAYHPPSICQSRRR